MNLAPNKVFTGKNSDGSSFTVQEWDFSTFVGWQMSGFLVMLVVGMLFCSIASPLILLFAIIGFSGRNKVQYVMGILISIYFLYDCNHGWLGLATLNLFAEESTINLIVGLNIISLVVLSLFLLFGSAFYTFIENTFISVSNRWTGFVVIVGLIMLITLIATESNLQANKGWVEFKMKDEKGNAERTAKYIKSQEDWRK